MAIVRSEVRIENKGDLFLVHRHITEMFNAQQFLKICEDLGNDKARMDENFKAFDNGKKLAHEVFLNQMKAKQTPKKVSEGLDIKK